MPILQTHCSGLMHIESSRIHLDSGRVVHSDVGGQGGIGRRWDIASLNSDRTLNTELLIVAVAIAAGFHDIGKLSAGFQGVLASSVEGRFKEQPVRHEFISLLLLRLIISLSHASCDVEFLKIISSPNRAIELAMDAWRLLPNDQFTQKFIGGSKDEAVLESAKDSILPEVKNFPFMRGVAFLVGTHHRVFRANVTRTSVDLLDTTHVKNHDARVWKSYIKDCDNLIVALDAPGHSSWVKTLSWDARRGVAAFDAGAVTGNYAAWSAACAHLGRTALMLGDQDGSSRKLPHDVPDVISEVSLVPYANTMWIFVDGNSLDTWRNDGRGRIFEENRSRNENKRRVLADTWSLHTHKVRRSALAALGGLLRTEADWIDIGWPIINEADIPINLRVPADHNSPYRWQDDAVIALKKSVEVNYDIDGRLLFLMSGTGSGKTIAAPKLALAAARNNVMRLNVCLGLRSLTLQTGDEYCGRMGVGQSQAAIVIGSKAATILHEIATQESAQNSYDDPAADAENEPSTMGIDADDFDDVGVIVGGYGAALPYFAQRVVDTNEFSDKRDACQRLLGSPIVICTVDTLSSVSDATGGRHLTAALRMATADLILDEIDSYDAEDFVALSRLVHFAAFHGRSVIVASATLRAEHAEAIRRAYALGRRMRSHGTSKNAAFLVGWFSENHATVEVDDSGLAADAFLLHHHRVASDIVASLGTKPTLRRLRVVSLDGIATHVGYRERTLESCIHLHNINHVVDPATSKRVSVGFVRWNRISSCRAFAAHVLDHAGLPGINLVIACHHSRFSLAVRDGVDRSLAKMLSRKTVEGGRDPLLDDPHIRRHLDGDSELDIVIIISTTPLLEAGRDLDADWAVTEPCSERSAIQLAGRVRRHRNWSPAGDNIGMLEWAVSNMFSPGNRALAHPGVETPLRMSPIAGGSAVATVPRERTAHVLFDITAWSERLDATSCLVGGNNACGLAEADMLRYGVLGNKKPDSVVCIGDNKTRTRELAIRFQDQAAILAVAGLEMRPEWPWNDAHPRLRKFRREDPLRTNVDFRLDNGEWWVRDEASIRSAKNARKTGLALLNEWQRVGSGRVKKDWCYPASTTVPGRLLFPSDMYDIEMAASVVEAAIIERGGRVSRFIAEELRMISTSPMRKQDALPTLFIHDIIGGHHSGLT